MMVMCNDIAIVEHDERVLGLSNVPLDIECDKHQDRVLVL